MKRILITGGTGSWGTALIKHYLNNSDYRLVCYSRDETKQAHLKERFPDPRLDCFLGDIRDLPRLQLAFEADIDTVIHCLDRDTSVVLASGEHVPVSTIVHNRAAVKVRSWNGHDFCDAEVTGWYENRRGQRQMICLSWDGGRIGGSRQQLWATADHQVLTPTGWRAAGDLIPGDEVMTGEPAPNERQLAFLAGTLLGDSSLVRRKRERAELTVSHSLRQEEWITLKANILDDFKPRLSTVTMRTPAPCSALQVGTRRWASLGRLSTLWYPEKKKRIPLSWLRERLLSAPALVLAAWYLDDGYLVPGTKTAMLCTDGFLREDVKGLVDVLQSTTGISAEVIEERAGNGRTRIRLRCSKAESDHWFAMIGRGIPPSMRYKSPPTAPPYDERFWDVGRAGSHVGTLVKSEAAAWTVNQRTRQQRVFCLGVEGTETFVAGGLLVHNCAALKRVDAISYNPEESLKTNIIGSMNVLHAARGTVKRCLLISSDKAVAAQNVYGATKMVAEQLFVTYNAASAPKGTISAVIRSGNALGSRGSVVPIWREQIAQGKPIQLTDPAMTRFLITLPQAAALVAGAATSMEGGEIVVPHLPAARLDDLAEAMAPGHPTEIIGLRPGGEKHHEALMASEEMVRAVALGDHYVIPPALAPWRTRSRYPAPNVTPIPGGFTSDNARRLTITEIRDLLAQMDGGV